VIVVSDTSPICYLVLIDAIDLLPQLYSQVIIPQAVCLELGALGAPSVLQEWINNPPPWLIVRAVEIVNDESLSSLDFGERHAIFLAEKIKAELIILDEREARKVAASKNLKVIGLLGVLYQAAIKDLIYL
jgi:predicted nucleic acid-binding protein